MVVSSAVRLALQRIETRSSTLTSRTVPNQFRCTSRATANRNWKTPSRMMLNTKAFRCTSRATANRNVSELEGPVRFWSSAVRLALQRIETIRHGT